MTDPEALAATELAAACSDPADALMANALRIWGEHLPLDVLQGIEARTGRRLSELRTKQRRLIELMRAAGQPPKPVLTTGEPVHLRDQPLVIGEVVSLTWRNAQVRLTDGSWITAPFSEFVRLFPPPHPVDPGLTRGQQAVARLRKRRSFLRHSATC